LNSIFPQPARREIHDIRGAFHEGGDSAQSKPRLSNRGRGDPEGADQGRVSSNFRGTFALTEGVLTFKNLAFTVPGADIRLNGTYGLRSEQLDFRATAILQAKLSQTTTGFKSFLLKAVAPLFRGTHAGAILPIKISGSKESPSFGLDLRGVK
jgi:hypothetical protein